MDRNKVIEAAARLVATGAFDEAIREYQRFLDVDPKDVWVLQKIGELFLKRNDLAQASRYFTRGAERYAVDGFFSKAVALYKQVLKLDPSLIALNLKLAELYEQLQLMPEAMASFLAAAHQYEKAGDTHASLDALTRHDTLKKMFDRDRTVPRIKPVELHDLQDPAGAQRRPASGRVSAAPPRAAAAGSEEHPLRVNLVSGVKASKANGFTTVAPQPRPITAGSLNEPRSPGSLGALLTRQSVISAAELNRATEAQRPGECLQTALIRTGAINESALIDFLSRHYGVPGIQVDDFDVDAEVRALIPEHVWVAWCVFPINVAGPSLIVAMRDPSDLSAIDDLRFLTGRYIEPVVSSEPSLRRTIERYGGRAPRSFPN